MSSAEAKRRSQKGRREQRRAVEPDWSSAKEIKVKEVVFIRHGHSLGQAAGGERRRVDPSLTDCDLSTRGHSQARDLAKTTRALRAAGLGPELVLTSPLTRALKTALILFEEEPIIVHPGLAELNHRRPIPENNGRVLKELLKDRTLNELGFEHGSARIQMDLVEVHGWPTERRADGLFYLRDRPEKRIVIVSHFNFILAQLREHMRGGVENCDPIHSVISFVDGYPYVQLHASKHAWFCESSLESPMQLTLPPSISLDETVPPEDSDIYEATDA